ncbi:hypothetical protein [Rubrolithibacter danxiaensis]|uniref:hypothetical protein n=1 Tax=Rubrolithibacter danxiaensis TaxID=3390805 RepID=UPI003BF8E56B
MKTSSLEITDREYLIKLNKEEFDLSFINQLLKRIQSEDFFTQNKYEDQDEELIRKVSYSDLSVRFDNLNEK